MELIAAVEQSAFATWIRESAWALFALLIVHTITMGTIVGAALAVCGRILGVARGVPLPAMGRVLPVMGWALLAAAASGTLLVVAYPAKALTNPLFYVKLTLAAVAVALTWTLHRRLFAPGLAQAPGWAKAAAVAAGLLWLSTLTAGKFLEYTHKMLLVG
jgi:hypothetical protein